jgi:hypothetical protein
VGPPDRKDVVMSTVRDLSETVANLNGARAYANHWLEDPNYEVLRLRLEMAHAAVEAPPVEARRQVRLAERRL